MEFSEATKRLMSMGVTLQEMADALGIAHTTIRAMRLDPASESSRRPPPGWELKLAQLAFGRGRDLRDLAWDIDEGAVRKLEAEV